ncbi:diguanylate cyclase (GGDEF)-like protein [Vibrio sp. ES.051]|uniref:sensor domain-containing diguanylate cyclase n=1 Tax=Vibrio sp. ES.051 TaxID=1761909 RepID=UPI000BF50B54|nr:sensor domain-containing diguanylate cyclase [Vibrio sp. ES.051]PFG56267.1 diguanylate cyclase (GGDEF)-like protein [Vibrio sp. ES.051]
MSFRKKINLRNLIVILCVFSVFVTLINAFYSIYLVQRELIVNNTLESNRVYAQKMSEMTDSFIESSMSQLKYSANLLNGKMHDTEFIDDETERLRTQTKSFNSVVIVNAKGVIVSVSPETVQVKGVTLTGERKRQSLNAQAPIITDPFVSPAGNYLLTLSYPIFSESNQYLGYVGGTIYLEQNNILGTLLNQHAYKDGSYLYVVDENKTLIYHPDKSRIGEVIDHNVAINAVVMGKSGNKTITNENDIEMLAGYSTVEASGWGVVAQRSKSITLSVLDEQMWNVFFKSIPIGLLTLLLIWLFSVLISKPLWQLAGAVRGVEEHSSSIDELKKVKAWYFEASNLKSSFLKAFGIVSKTIDKLQLDTLTDAMTGLLNRRGLEKLLELFKQQNKAFSLLALDIDHFKRVNDNYGHDVGDHLLKEFAQLMKEQARANDHLCRSGGEEFMMFLEDTDVHHAVDVAERIRKTVEHYDFQVVDKVTVSIGVSHWKGNDIPIAAVMKDADNALYKAKHNGRNRIELSPDLN